jgi:hypothetical protein
MTHRIPSNAPNPRPRPALDTQASIHAARAAVNARARSAAARTEDELRPLVGRRVKLEARLFNFLALLRD